MSNAVHFGAGRIGRGFLGPLLFAAGCHTLFIDTDPSLVAALHARGGYPLRLVDTDGGVQNMTIGAVDALRVAAEAADAIAQANLLSTAVGVNTLSQVAPLLADGINRRAAQSAAPLNILLCENGWHVADTLRELLTPHIAPVAQDYFQRHVGLVECVVGRMVPVPTEAARREDPLLLVTEPYTELSVDASALRGPLPPLPGLIVAEGFDAFEARKLFLHNMGHVALAYAGWQKGYTFIWQCVQDAEVADLCRAAMREVQTALAAEYGFDPDSLAQLADELMRRFANRALGDTVTRVAADPLRKLGPHERLLGAVRLCERQQMKTIALMHVIDFALAYDNPDDPAAVRMQARRVTADDVLAAAGVRIRERQGT